MTPDEVTDELIRIASIQAPHERAAEIRDLKTASRIGITDLKASLAMILRAQQEAASEQRQDPIMARLNEEGWFMLLETGKVWAARLKESALNGHSVRKLDCMSVPDFCTWVHHLDPETSLEESPGKVWYRNPVTPRYDGTTIDTNAPLLADGKLNLWRGFGVKPKEDAEALNLFQTHVSKVCAGDAKATKYLLDWMAYGFQNPSKRTGTAIVMIGAPGTGKGMLGNLLASIWGSHGMALRDKRSIVGDFNSHLTECAFAFLDEALFSGDKQTADKIKGLITEPTLMTEAKFKNRAETTNMLKFMIASNHDHAVQVDPKDRRFAVIKVPDDMPPSDSPYWKEFYKVCHSVKGKGAILHHMLGRCVKNFNPEADRPVTEGYTDQKRASLQGDMQYWRQVIEEGTLNPGEKFQDQTSGDWPTRDDGGSLMKDSLYQFYSRWHKQNERYGSPVLKQNFFKNAKEIGVIEPADVRGEVDGQRVRVAKLISFDQMEDALTNYLTIGKL
jgi:hypothetical protein